VTLNETKCVGKEKEFQLTAEDVDVIREAVSSISDTERQVDNLLYKLGLEDASAITQRKMEYVKLLTAFPIEMAFNVETVLEEAEQKKQKFESEC
jgi:predicted nucleotide-binding protein (sugar kinase/HSP70/actin superfamily)